MTYTINGLCTDGSSFGITLDGCDDSAEARAKAVKAIKLESGRTVDSCEVSRSTVAGRRL